MNNRDVLRREFERIAQVTDEAWREFQEEPTKVAEQRYQGWAALLLRYHAALEQIAKETPSAGTGAVGAIKARTIGE